MTSLRSARQPASRRRTARTGAELQFPVDINGLFKVAADDFDHHARRRGRGSANAGGRRVPGSHAGRSPRKASMATSLRA